MEQILQRAKDGKIQLVLSEWVINEAMWAAVKKQIHGKIGKQEVSVIFSQIAEAIETGLNEGYIVSYAINEKVVVTSRVIIEELFVHPGDALHVLIAITSGCNIFLTADDDLIIRIRHAKLNLVPLRAIDEDAMNEFIKSL